MGEGGLPLMELSPTISSPFVVTEDNRIQLAGDSLPEMTWGMPREEAQAVANEYMAVVPSRERHVAAILQRIERFNFVREDGGFGVKPEQKGMLLDYLNGVTNYPDEVDTPHQPRWVEALHYYNKALTTLHSEAPSENVDQKTRQSYRSQFMFYREMVSRLETNLVGAHAVHAGYLQRLRAEIKQKMLEEFGFDGSDMDNGPRQIVNTILQSIDTKINRHQIKANENGELYTTTAGAFTRESAMSPAHSMD